MKEFETKLDVPNLEKDFPFIIRLDGHKFSTFTKNFKKPYDERSIHSFFLQSKRKYTKRWF